MITYCLIYIIIRIDRVYTIHDNIQCGYYYSQSVMKIDSKGRMSHGVKSRLVKSRHFWMKERTDNPNYEFLKFLSDSLHLFYYAVTKQWANSRSSNECLDSIDDVTNSQDQRLGPHKVNGSK